MISKKLFFVALAGLAFTACNKDDEKVELSVTDQLQANKWVYSAYISDGDDEISECEKDDTFEFKAGNKLTVDVGSQEGECDNGIEMENPAEGAYAVKGEELSIVAGFFSGNYTIDKLDDSDLWILDEDEDQLRFKAAKQ